MNSRFFISLEDTIEFEFKAYILERVRKDNPDLPSDAEIAIHWPTEQDPRFWVDVLSEQHCKDTDDSDYDEQPNGDPIFDQYVLVSNDLLQKECPEFFDKYNVFDNPKRG
ncbi:hypothetical protein Lepto7375DRAFT_7243 [Leptolyngbya sp. PCC 7375]|nr:hypothetical protein Lepto7375DRAFT_7243 [Leptolyngbya sp. PCC 7375]